MTTPTGILFQEPINQPLSTNGLVQSGAYYCFFTTGTTTPVTVYANGTLATPLSQPIPGSVSPVGGSTTTVANASGQFVPIYLTPGVIYRRQLYASTGSLLSDVDPYVTVSTVGLGGTNTWSGAQTFTGGVTVSTAGLVVSPSSGVGVSLTAATGAVGEAINAAAGQYGLLINGSGTSGQSLGLKVAAGTNSSDFAADIRNAAGTGMFQVRGDGTILGVGITSTTAIDMSPDAGTFTGTITNGVGGATITTGTFSWKKFGKWVQLSNDTGSNIASTATSPAALGITGMPAEIYPSVRRYVFGSIAQNASANPICLADISTGGVIELQMVHDNGSNVGLGGNFGTTTVGVAAGWSITYAL